MASLHDQNGLHFLCGPSGSAAVADIVFVHGLCGKSHDTWRHGRNGDDDHFFWPEELGKDLKACNVWTVGYEADILNASGKGMVIGIRATSIASLLLNQGVGTSRPVIFICHSMGGLVVKALVDWGRQNTEQSYEDLVGNIKGIVFCGTPHLGSNFAATAKLLGKMLGGSTAWTNEMCIGENGIQLLHERFLGWLRHNPIKILTIVEHSTSFGFGFWRLKLGIVVPRSSAILGIEQNEFVIQHGVADHLQLVKPDSFADITYSSTLKFILERLP